MSNETKQVSIDTKTIPVLRSMSRLKELQHNPLEFLSGLTAEFGDIVQIKLFFWPVIIINHPDYIKRVLQENYRNYDKNVPIFNLFRPILGNGLVTNYGGESWLRQRRLMQPAFHRQRTAALGTIITESTRQLLTQWEGPASRGEAVDVADTMMHLTLNIVGRSLFGIDITGKTHTFGKAFSDANAFLLEYFNRPFPPLSVPTPRHRRFHRDVRSLDKVVYEIVQQRRASQEAHEDLLSMLIEARDEETGEGMNDQQLRDEVMTLLIAGHETVANALAWAWYLLAQHPEVEQKLQAELAQVLAGRPPTIEDLPRLSYTRMVFEESMRLYPPVWIIMRKSLAEDTLGGYPIPAQTYIAWSTYAMHRHPEFWERPEEFYPEHFTTEQVARRPRHAYIPFSHGPRICIGNTFALTEAQLVLATIAQRYSMKLVPDHPVTPNPLMTLSPRQGIRMYLQAR
ncbi:cytochrome P450 [Dictyobacter aurantiacus]|uniref:Cytochrome P450 n=1 Tax=Dictyobacter aurantiacus TaxID=1936993 RepID=A0A401ZDM8_9CHLR|nr:cytochrome P450 [Dictyobacter aurantiacus]GCE04991.1 cytochrome P450 [Dictyobacter aurantiacus]